MAFKSIEQFNDDKYRYMFRLTEDGQSADVIFLYRSKADMLIGPAHYINSNEYTGYVECCGQGCPACAKGIRKDSGKIFIPLYNLSTQKIEFWDRNQSFEHHMDRMVFNNYPNPSELIFTITRHGDYRGEKVTFDIVATYKNNVMTYDQILAKFNTTMEAYYSNICREYSISDLERILSTNTVASASTLSEYTPKPRAGYVAPTIPGTYVDVGSMVSDNTPSVASDVIPDTSVLSESDNEVDSETTEDDLADPIF